MSPASIRRLARTTALCTPIAGLGPRGSSIAGLCVPIVTTICFRIRKIAAKMAAQHGLPMGTHDETRWTDAHARAFDKFVKGQSRALSLLRVSAERDEAILSSMRKPE
jgi:hypothetical protein